MFAGEEEMILNVLAFVGQKIMNHNFCKRILSKSR